MFLADVGHSLAIGFYDLEIVVVDPDASLEVAFLAFDFFGRDVEYVALQFVFFLLAHVEDVVFGKIFLCQHERQAVADILEILLRHENLGETGLRREYHVLDAMALVVKHDVEDFVILAVDRAAVEGLHFDVLAVGVLVAGFGKFRFLGGKALDNFFRRGAGGGSVFERPFLSACGQSGQSAGEHGQTNQQTNEYRFHEYSLANFGRGCRRVVSQPRCAQSVSARGSLLFLLLLS